MIYGIGTDICDIRRLRKSFERHGERLAQRILGTTELAAWQARNKRCPERGLRYLATRFSAKESFSKAIGLGMRMPMTWRHCEIINAASGKPQVVLHATLKAWFEGQQLNAQVSVSDETDYACSFVVVSKNQYPNPHTGTQQ